MKILFFKVIRRDIVIRLIMYLIVLDNSMGCVLGQHDESGQKEHAIYYLSKRFTECETRYSLLEKTC